MKTLRGEGLRLMGCTDDAEEFFHCYGNWQVVEGLLRVEWSRAMGKTRVWLQSGSGPLASQKVVHVGYTGDHVKLIVPPEEKMLEGARERILEAQLVATRGREFAERDRADKYEKALREIAGPGKPGSLAACLTRIYHRAQGALDADTD